MDSSPGLCWVCEATGPLWCSACRFALYCSIACQKKDRLRHLDECVNSSRRRVCCSYCGREEALGGVPCPECLVAAYCTDSCRKIDAKNHRSVCLQAKQKVVEAAKKIDEWNRRAKGIPQYLGRLIHAVDYLSWSENEGAKILAEARSTQHKEQNGEGGSEAGQEARSGRQEGGLAQETLRLLLLGADLKHVLCTLHNTPDTCTQDLEMVLVDSSPHILARDLLILYLLMLPDAHDPLQDPALVQAHAEKVVMVFYSLCLDMETHALLCNTLHNLLNMTHDAFLHETHQQVQVDAGTYTLVQTVWSGWMSFANDTSALHKLEKVRSLKVSGKMLKDVLARYIKSCPKDHQKAVTDWIKRGSLKKCRGGEFPNVTLACFSPLKQEYLDKFEDVSPKWSEETEWIKAVTAEDDMIYAPHGIDMIFQDWDFLTLSRKVKKESNVIEMYRVYLTEVFSRSSYKLLRSKQVSITFIRADVRDLSADTQRLSGKFDRVATGIHADLLGTPCVLQHFGSLLRTDNIYSRLLTHHRVWSLCLDWRSDQQARETCLKSLKCNRAPDPLLMITGRWATFRHFLQAELLHHLHVLDGRPLEPENVLVFKNVSHAYDMVLSDYTRQLNHIVPFRFQADKRTVSMVDSRLHTLEWRRLGRTRRASAPAATNPAPKSLPSTPNHDIDPACRYVDNLIYLSQNPSAPTPTPDSRQHSRMNCREGSLSPGPIEHSSSRDDRPSRPRTNNRKRPRSLYVSTRCKSPLLSPEFEFWEHHNLIQEKKAPTSRAYSEIPEGISRRIQKALQADTKQEKITPKSAPVSPDLTRKTKAVKEKASAFERGTAARLSLPETRKTVETVNPSTPVKKLVSMFSKAFAVKDKETEVGRRFKRSNSLHDSCRTPEEQNEFKNMSYTNSLRFNRSKSRTQTNGETSQTSECSTSTFPRMARPHSIAVSKFSYLEGCLDKDQQLNNPVTSSVTKYDIKKSMAVDTTDSPRNKKGHVSPIRSLIAGLNTVSLSPVCQQAAARQETTSLRDTITIRREELRLVNLRPCSQLLPSLVSPSPSDIIQTTKRPEPPAAGLSSNILEKKKFYRRRSSFDTVIEKETRARKSPTPSPPWKSALKKSIRKIPHEPEYMAPSLNVNKSQSVTTQSPKQESPKIQTTTTSSDQDQNVKGKTPGNSESNSVSNLSDVQKRSLPECIFSPRPFPCTNIRNICQPQTEGCQLSVRKKRFGMKKETPKADGNSKNFMSKSDASPISSSSRSDSTTPISPSSKSDSTTSISPSSKSDSTTPISPSSKSDSTTTISPSTKSDSTTPISPSSKSDSTTPISPSSKSDSTTTISPSTKSDSTTPISPSSKSDSTTPISPSSKSDSTTTISPSTKSDSTTPISPSTKSDSTTPISPSSKSDFKIHISPSSKSDSTTYISPSSKFYSTTPISPSSKSDSTTPISPSSKSDFRTLISPFSKSDSTTLISPSSKSDSMTPISPSSKSDSKTLISPSSKSDSTSPISLSSKSDSTTPISPSSKSDSTTPISPSSKLDSTTLVPPSSKSDFTTPIPPSSKSDSTTLVPPSSKSDFTTPIPPSSKSDSTTPISPSSKSDFTTPVFPSTKSDFTTPIPPIIKADFTTPVPPSSKSDFKTPISLSSKSDSTTPISPSSKADFTAPIPPSSKADPTTPIPPSNKADSTTPIRSRKSNSTTPIPPSSKSDFTTPVPPSSKSNFTTPISPSSKSDSTTPISPSSKADFTAPIPPSSKADPTTPISPSSKSDSTIPISPSTTPISPSSKSDSTTPISPSSKPDSTTPISPSSKADPTTPIPPSSKTDSTTPISSSTKSDFTAPIPPSSQADPTTPISPSSQSDSTTPVPPSSKAHPTTPIPPSSKSDSTTPVPLSSKSDFTTPVPPTSKADPTTPISPSSKSDSTTFISPSSKSDSKTPVSPSSKSDFTIPVPPSSKSDPPTPISPFSKANPTTPISPYSKSDLTTPVSPSSKSDRTTPISPSSKADPTTPISPSSKSDSTTSIPPSSKSDPTTPISPSSKADPTTPISPSSKSDSTTSVPPSSKPDSTILVPPSSTPDFITSTFPIKNVPDREDYTTWDESLGAAIKKEDVKAQKILSQEDFMSLTSMSSSLTDADMEVLELLSNQEQFCPIQVFRPYTDDQSKAFILNQDGERNIERESPRNGTDIEEHIIEDLLLPDDTDHPLCKISSEEDIHLEYIETDSGEQSPSTEIKEQRTPSVCRMIEHFAQRIQEQQELLERPPSPKRDIIRRTFLHQTFKEMCSGSHDATQTLIPQSAEGSDRLIPDNLKIRNTRDLETGMEEKISESTLEPSLLTYKANKDEENLKTKTDEESDITPALSSPKLSLSLQGAPVEKLSPTLVNKMVEQFDQQIQVRSLPTSPTTSCPNSIASLIQQDLLRLYTTQSKDGRPKDDSMEKSSPIGEDFFEETTFEIDDDDEEETEDTIMDTNNKIPPESETSDSDDDVEATVQMGNKICVTPKRTMREIRPSVCDELRHEFLQKIRSLDDDLRSLEKKKYEERRSAMKDKRKDIQHRGKIATDEFANVQSLCSEPRPKDVQDAPYTVLVDIEQFEEDSEYFTVSSGYEPLVTERGCRDSKELRQLEPKNQTNSKSSEDNTLTSSNFSSRAYTGRRGSEGNNIECSPNNSLQKKSVEQVIDSDESLHITPMLKFSKTGGLDRLSFRNYVKSSIANEDLLSASEQPSTCVLEHDTKVMEYTSSFEISTEEYRADPESVEEAVEAISFLSSDDHRRGRLGQRFTLYSNEGEAGEDQNCGDKCQEIERQKHKYYTRRRTLPSAPSDIQHEDDYDFYCGSPAASLRSCDDKECTDSMTAWRDDKDSFVITGCAQARHSSHLHMRHVDEIKRCRQSDEKVFKYGTFDVPTETTKDVRRFTWGSLRKKKKQDCSKAKKEETKPSDIAYIKQDNFPLKIQSDKVNKGAAYNFFFDRKKTKFENDPFPGIPDNTRTDPSFDKKLTDSSSKDNTIPTVVSVLPKQRESEPSDVDSRIGRERQTYRSKMASDLMPKLRKRIPFYRDSPSSSDNFSQSLLRLIAPAFEEKQLLSGGEDSPSIQGEASEVSEGVQNYSPEYPSSACDRSRDPWVRRDLQDTMADSASLLDEADVFSNDVSSSNDEISQVNHNGGVEVRPRAGVLKTGRDRSRDSRRSLRVSWGDLPERMDSPSQLSDAEDHVEDNNDDEDTEQDEHQQTQERDPDKQDEKAYRVTQL